MTISKMIEWEVPALKPPTGENIFMGTLKSSWEFPVPQWSKNSENRHIEEKKNSFTLPALPLPQGSTAQWQEIPSTHNFSNKGKWKWAPNCPSLEDAAQEAHFCLTQPRTEEISMAESAWATGTQISTTGHGSHCLLMDTKRCGQEKR